MILLFDTLQRGNCVRVASSFETQNMLMTQKLWVIKRFWETALLLFALKLAVKSCVDVVSTLPRIRSRTNAVFS